MRDLRLVAVEDDARFRAGLATLFAHSPGFEMVAGFGTAEALLAKLNDYDFGGVAPWDLVLMDLELPGLGGIEATRRVKETLPSVSVVVLTVFEEPSTVLEAICAGADGYLLKQTPPALLLEELRAVRSGGAPLTAGVARSLVELLRIELGGQWSRRGGARPTRLGLTEREQEVLRCLVDGRSYKQVAAHLGIRLDTVRSHVRNVYSKLQVHSVADAVRRALRERLI